MICGFIPSEWHRGEGIKDPFRAVVAINIPAGQWHTVKALESGTVIIEMKNGPYEPLGAEDVLMVNG